MFIIGKREGELVVSCMFVTLYCTCSIWIEKKAGGSWPLCITVFSLPLLKIWRRRQREKRDRRSRGSRLIGGKRETRKKIHYATSMLLLLLPVISGVLFLEFSTWGWIQLKVDDCFYSIVRHLSERFSPQWKKRKKPHHAGTPLWKTARSCNRILFHTSLQTIVFREVNQVVNDVSYVCLTLWIPGSNVRSTRSR